MVQLFAFDYGRTLFDRERDDFFSDVEIVLKALAENHRLAIVSYSSPNEVKERRAALACAGLLDLFEYVLFADTPEGKDQAYEQLLSSTRLKANDMAIVDDYTVRGIAWGNRHGAITYWFQNGKFASVEPNEQTGVPTHIIGSLSDILETI